MSGERIVRYLLANNSALLAVVPAARIVSGFLPLAVVLPAVETRQISSMPYNLIRINDTPKVHIDRVQVSVLCKDPQTATAGTGYPGIKTILTLVLAACPSQRGSVNGIQVDSITPDMEGPVLYDPIGLFYSGSRDFLVRWIA